MDFSDKTNGELFALLANVMRELRKRDLVRTANNPVADLGERLFCSALGWHREQNQAKDFDAITEKQEKVQIKARRMTREKDSMRSGVIRDKEGWDLIALAMFDADFMIKRAIIVPRQTVLRHMKWSKRQLGWYISLTQRFWREPDIVDVSKELHPNAEALFLQRQPEAIEPAHLPDVLESLAQAKRREFATDAEVEAAFRRFDP